jgi:hypothetical protein
MNSERVLAAQTAIHDEVCPVPKADPHPALSCLSTPRAAVVARALEVLDVRPRDAKGARLVFHDAACMSGCTGAGAEDHARRTQTDVVRALRRWLAGTMVA